METIRVRNPRFDFSASTQVRWLGGRAMSTHVMNAFTLVFPEGERFLVRLMRRAFVGKSVPADVELFMAQEASHAREHQRYLGNLRAAGFRIDWFLSLVSVTLRVIAKLPVLMQLAIGAGAEHLATACGKEALRRDVFAKADDELRALFLWHAIEEVEHRAVVFDVLRARSPSYSLRLAGYMMSLLCIGGLWSFGALMLLIQDSWLTRGTPRHDAGGLLPDVLRLGRECIRYIRPTFHPSDDDSDALLRALGNQPSPAPPRLGVRREESGRHLHDERQ